MNNVIALIGRVLLSLIFILSGVSKIGSYAQTVMYMESHGVPMAPIFLYATVLIELGCGLSLLTGYRARLSALALAIFLIPVTFIFHFKPAFDPAFNIADRLQLIQVLKNAAIMGALLLVYANGAGSLTIGKDS